VARVASTTRSDQTAQSRQRIVDAAAEMFAERGYDATSMRDLAKQLGLTRAALYYHYSAKSDILREIINTETAQFLANMNVVATLASQSARADAVVAALVEAGLNQRRRIALLVSEPAIRALPEPSDGSPNIFSRVTEVIYGAAPTAEQTFAATTAFMTFAALPSFVQMTDDELAPILTRALNRLLRVPLRASLKVENHP
jgi:AcrR family transcriptional regulator